MQKYCHKIPISFLEGTSLPGITLENGPVKQKPSVHYFFTDLQYLLDEKKVRALCRCGVVVNVLVRINMDTLCQAWLLLVLLGRATVCGQVNHLSM